LIRSVCDGEEGLMSFISTIPESEAEGETAEMYASTRDSMGYLPNYTRAFGRRPQLYAAWANLIKTVRSNMDPRRYELATMGAAVTLQNSYCSLAHGEKLLDLGSTKEEVRSLANPGNWSSLPDVERVIVSFAAKVAESATSVTQGDIDGLRSLGLTDAEIFDVAATAAARCFLSKLMDATGTLPDGIYRQTIPDLVDDLAVGRPVAQVAT
jgi:uncharacterized peroxidase-related enzyme